MSEAVLIYSVADGVATLTLNRPEKRNALNAELVQALKKGLAEAAEDPAVRVVAITGAGQDFCSGADLAELRAMSEKSAEENLADARSLGALFSQMRRHPRPIVALVKGRALAGGCGLATACDVVLARSDAEFGYPEVHLGFVPALVMAILRRKIGEGRTFDLVAMGERFSAAEGERLGLVNRVYESFTFKSEANNYVAAVAARPVSAITLTKTLLYELDGMDFQDGIDRAAEVNAEARMTAECREGVRRFLDRSKG
ncbi:MAG: enoyl-CoA hydratase-related protein [Gemmatimonadetes bacterium]|nr:enoyl-CoA hydratase-related protein [Gemmatimonadota bacterium]MDA1102879.1 enoyl-CoA hydratase-related protein [Gemmatimonadota bacterium]